MRAVMQMLDCYVSKYNFIMNKKILPTTDLAIDGKLGYRQIDEEERDNSIVIVLELQNDISIKEKNNNMVNNLDDGNINVSMIGVFSFDKDIDKSEMERMISVNCVAILYQQMRAYITSNTALSGSVPNIVLPVLNFTNN